MAKQQNLAEVSVGLSAAKKALDQAYNDLGVEMQQRGLVSMDRLKGVKDALESLDSALPKETRKLNAEAEAAQ